jgi:hypothetical protein
LREVDEVRLKNPENKRAKLGKGAKSVQLVLLSGSIFHEFIVASLLLFKVC